MLFLVPTPIGNLKDISIRAVETLQNCDEIICEDTRRASILLNHFNIKKPLLVLNDYNEPKVIENILYKLKSGKNICLISDAGTPLIQDPGFKLVRLCLDNNIQIDSLPGASSILTALTLSSLPPDKFMYLGYPPEKPGKRQNLWTKINQISQILNTTFILFIAPHKLIKTLPELNKHFGDIEITLAKELTKIHQRVESKTISQWLENMKQTPKGEFVLLFNLSKFS